MNCCWSNTWSDVFNFAWQCVYGKHKNCNKKCLFLGKNASKFTLFNIAFSTVATFVASLLSSFIRSFRLHFPSSLKTGIKLSTSFCQLSKFSSKLSFKAIKKKHRQICKHISLNWIIKPMPPSSESNKLISNDCQNSTTTNQKSK